MARYIDADKLIEFITKGLNNPDKTKAFGYDAIEILTEIEYTPTADVAPKSEVAREIFEEIELKLSANRSGELLSDGKWFVCFDIQLAEEIAELKKKYTEGEK